LIILRPSELLIQKAFCELIICFYKALKKPERERGVDMTGTLINVVTVLIGGTLGLLFGERLPDRIKQTVVAGMGLFTLVVGISMFLETNQAIVVLLSLLFGGLLGEWWKIEDRLERLGVILEERFSGGDVAQANRFVKGFLTASLLFIIGPMAILGSIQDGVEGRITLLAIKSVLDGFAAMAFAASFGIGVLFSVLVVFVYQGGITLLAAQAAAVLTEAMMAELTATGGVILVGLAVSSLLEIKPIRVGNFLPALVIAPALSPLFERLMDVLGLVV
jgi:uncharacterized membrane protein YqgA involved in biofilm formation